MTMKNKKIKIKTTGEMIDRITDIKVSMMSLEMDNTGIFGDDDILSQSRLFNNLTDPEKNLWCLYILLGSYAEMEKYLNVKRSTISQVLKKIRQKLRLSYENDNNL